MRISLVVCSIICERHKLFEKSFLCIEVPMAGLQSLFHLILHGFLFNVFRDSAQTKNLAFGGL